MNYSKEYIEAINKVFIEYHKLGFDDSKISSIALLTKIDPYYVESIISVIKLHGNTIGLFQKYNGGVKPNKINCETFIDNGGFITYFNDLKPKPWYKKLEVWIPILISFGAFCTPFIIRYLDKNELDDYTKKRELINTIDSIYMASQKYSDSLLQTTNKTIHDLKDSLYIYSFDSIKH